MRTLTSAMAAAAVASLLAVAVVVGGTAIFQQNSRPSPPVKVCIAPTGYAYHKNKDCPSLKNSKAIDEVTLKEAKQLGRKPYKFCQPPTEEPKAGKES